MKPEIDKVAVVQNLAQVVYEEQAKEFDSNWQEARRGLNLPVGLCVFTVRSGLEACRYFGIPAVAMAVEVIAGNAAWREWMENDPTTEMPEEAWAVSASPQTPVPGGGLDGHLVLGLPEFAVVVDADSGQLSRPAKGMAIPDYLAFPAEPEFFTESDAAEVLITDDGTTIVYRRNPDVSDSWMTAPDFKLQSADARRIRGRIIRRLREVASS